ncbi:MAG: acetyl-CoA hydrolase/transferase C-terminal domain-containing protein [Deferrisomatales bacterium]|nr:acetyl-CoA hydrolase/transferase C-terminal domain-containing protein [Deferrisomatales bacterium]
MSRILCPALERVRRSPEDAAALVQSGWTVATTGTTTGGYPRAFFRALTERAEAGVVGELCLWSIAPLGDPVDGALARARALRRRLGMQANPDLTQAINQGQVSYADWGVSAFCRKARSGAFGRPDVAVVEVAGIAEDGTLIPSLCLGDAPTMVALADRVVVEVNHWLPLGLEGIHDVLVLDPPPRTKPIPILKPLDRVGVPRIPVDPEKIVAVVESDEAPDPIAPAPIGEVQETIARNLRLFLEGEWHQGRLPKPLPPLQVGLGALGDAVVEAMTEGPWGPISLHSPLLGDAALQLLEAGRIEAVSGSGLFLSAAVLERLPRHLEAIRERLIIRPVDVVASPEVIGRLGCIGINSAIEVDVYGHANSSHLEGGKLVSGVGGSIEYARNALVSVFATPSTARAGAVSAVTARVCHCDHTEHEVDVLVTEQGWADLRGTDPRERAVRIIEGCAHPSHRPLLRARFEKAGSLHEPQIQDDGTRLGAETAAPC